MLGPALYEGALVVVLIVAIYVSALASFSECVSLRPRVVTAAAESAAWSVCKEIEGA